MENNESISEYLKSYLNIIQQAHIRNIWLENIYFENDITYQNYCEEVQDKIEWLQENGW
jgi:hypothetical protein|tara:strand:- start:538 stop:714 length:177 start_codon:yes stop_codon:yes gene_type:complete